MQTVDIVESAKNNISIFSMETFERAFPLNYDGLKPVHRRILYDMHKRQNYNYVKVANIVGSTMGQFHPHGDSSIYGALVRLAQPWVTNHVLVDIRGNKGTIDGDAAAAGRYIEAKLSDFSKYVVLDDLDQVTVNYSDNYDYTLKCPDYLPVKIPLLLVNGIKGLGEAFSCDIPPHNLNDVADRCIMYVKNKNISNDAIVDGLYPDYPTGGEILNGDDVAKFYKTGEKCSVIVRGKAKFLPETNTINLVEFPYGVPVKDITTAVRKEIAAGNMILGGIETILDTNTDKNKGDSSDNFLEETVYEFTCKKEANMSEILNEMCRVTNFKTSNTMSFMFTKDGYPRYVTVLDIIKDWYKIRVDCIRRRHTNNIKQSATKLHVLEGIFSIYDKIDDVVDTIRKNKDGKDALIKTLHKKFGLTVVQAEGIYNMNLGSLSNFGKDDLVNRIDNLRDSIEQDEYVLNNIDKVIIGELETIKHKFGRPRRTIIHKNLKISESERPVITKGTFLYSANMIGLYDSNGCRDSKSILTGMRPFKTTLGKSVKEIVGGTSLNGTPIAFAVCYSDATIQRIDSSVFKVLNVWYDTKCDDKEGRYITSACPIYSEEDELICLSEDLKMKRILVSDLNKRAVGSGSNIISIVPHKPEDPDLLDYMLCGTSIDKKGDKVPSYSIAPIDDIPVVSRSASGVKCAYNEGEFDKQSGLYITLVDMGKEETTRIFVSSIDNADSQNYIYTIPANELFLTGRTNKPKCISLPKGHSLTSVSLIDVSDKEKTLCMIGKSSSSTLSVGSNFKKAYILKKVFLTTVASTIL